MDNEIIIGLVVVIFVVLVVSRIKRKTKMTPIVRPSEVEDTPKERLLDLDKEVQAEDKKNKPVTPNFPVDE